MLKIMRPEMSKSMERIKIPKMRIEENVKERKKLAND